MFRPLSRGRRRHGIEVGGHFRPSRTGPDAACVGYDGALAPLEVRDIRVAGGLRRPRDSASIG